MKTKSKNLTSKRDFYFAVLNSLKQTTNLTKIKKDLNISKQNLNYYLRKLKKDGYLLNKGYGHWEVKNEVKNLAQDTKKYTPPKLIRGHAFIWTINIDRKIPNWNNRLERLKEKNIPFKLVGAFKTTPRVFINNRKIWLGNKTLTIFEPNSFYGKNAIESRKYAVFELLDTLTRFERKFGVSIQPYQFKPAREHYGLIKNDLAIQCNKNGEKIHIRDDLEGEWLWIDNSLSLGELETGGKKALIRNIQVQGWWNDNKKHNFEVTPSFILKGISGLLETQQMNADNIIKHQKVLDEMLITLKSIRDNIKK